MRLDVILVAFGVLVVIYSLVWFAVYQSLTTKRSEFSPVDSTPIETTTAEQRALGQSSFVIQTGREFGITRPGFFSFVILGYIALAVGLAIAFIVLFRSSTT